MIVVQGNAGGVQAVINNSPVLARGGEGRGDGVVLANNLTVQGSLELPRFAGGSGRGDDMKEHTALSLQGLSNPLVQTLGGAGRGDVVAQAMKAARDRSQELA